MIKYRVHVCSRFRVSCGLLMQSSRVSYGFDWVSKVCSFGFGGPGLMGHLGLLGFRVKWLGLDLALRLNAKP